MTTALRRLQLRIERSCEKFGASYPWWLPTYSTLAGVAIAVAAWWQRGGIEASWPMHLALLLCIYPLLLWIPTAYMTHPAIEAVAVVAGAAIFLSDKVTPDLAPLVFVVSAGEVAAVARPPTAVAVSAANIATLGVAAGFGHLDNVGLYIVTVVLGGSVGAMMRAQMRALRAEKDNSGIAQERAILTERQRLAQEVHDVVGHSLSINLLHVTAARHSLQEHADIDDAIDSLTEAERVGRSAMGDLRRTVAVLAAGPGETQPLPGVSDIATLVERSRAAGLDVTYACDIDASRLGDAAGLGLFRIVQESLGNIARHASTASAEVTLVEDVTGVRLSVHNTLPAGPPEPTSGGSGLPGMAARAEQLGAELRAGVDGDRWLVEVVVP